MSIFDTKHERVELGEPTFEPESATVSGRTRTTKIETKDSARRARRATRCFTALHHVKSSRNFGPLVSEPSIYDDFRTSVARRYAARLTSLRD